MSVGLTAPTRRELAIHPTGYLGVKDNLNFVLIWARLKKPDAAVVSLLGSAGRELITERTRLRGRF